MAVVAIETAAEIYAADGGSPNVLEGVLVHNSHSTSDLYVAVYNSGVDAADPAVSEITTSNGVPIAAGGSLSFDLRSGDSLRGISSSGSINVRLAVLRGG